MASVTQLLSEAREAQHALLTGGGVAEVRDANGETIRYTPANSVRLAAYIANLERQVAGSTGGPMQSFFA